MFLKPPSDPPAPDREVRRRPLDDPRVLIGALCLLLAVLAGLFWLSNQTSEIPIRILNDSVFYALLAVDLALVAALGFVLLRSLVKLWVEQRQSAPFARFRAKLVAALLAMAIVPAVLVLVSGSEIIRNSFSRWFSEPVDALLSASQDIARRYYQERQDATEWRALRLARTLAPTAVAAGDVGELDPAVKTELVQLRNGAIDVYRAVPVPGGPADAQWLVGGESSVVRHRQRASTDLLAARAIGSQRAEPQQEELDSGVLLVRTAVPIIGAENAVVGAVVVSEFIDSTLKQEARRATTAYEEYKQLETFRGPIQGVYLSIFLAVTLLILVSATWMGLYFAKRITRPVEQLAEGARAIGAGRLDVRLEAESSDELGRLIEAFNMMAAEVRTSQEKLEQSRQTLERAHAEVDARRRYIETILERVATGVISLDADERISTVNGAAERLLGLDAGSVGQPISDALGREDLRPLLPLLDSLHKPSTGPLVQELTLARDGRETHLAAAGTRLLGDDGRSEGAVLVLDDVTPLIRAQRVAAWRDVARRLAHEIKNPLTPIQLSADRLRRHFSNATPNSWALVDECTGAIITEVEALKGLVDEFAQFARLRGPRMVPTDVSQLVEDTLRLYVGVLQHGSLRLEQHLSHGMPSVRLDPEQIRQVIINLVDNAMEACGGPSAPMTPAESSPAIIVATSWHPDAGVVRLTVTDNGPGVAPEDREKLFMPYYSTKGRGSGLGLAIVRRIVVEHGGTIDVADAKPSGTTFTVELPVT
jgi:two-component system nitrogen regulation sensor histidine kinase NtrY